MHRKAPSPPPTAHHSVLSIVLNWKNYSIQNINTAEIEKLCYTSASSTPWITYLKFFLVNVLETANCTIKWMHFFPWHRIVVRKWLLSQHLGGAIWLDFAEVMCAPFESTWLGSRDAFFTFSSFTWLLARCKRLSSGIWWPRGHQRHKVEEGWMTAQNTYCWPGSSVDCYQYKK